jgi:hypothetical protein
MKKNLAFVLVSLALAGCKKDFICSCSYSGAPEYYSETYHDYQYKARQKCDELSNNAAYGSTCHLK